MHPLNIVLALKEANVKDEITLCAGLIHDLVEEEVDIYKKEKNVSKDRKGLLHLDQYEEKLFLKLKKEMVSFCRSQNYPSSIAKEIISVTRLLTRHKEEYYYQSLGRMFSLPDKDSRERALQIKMADRMHNVLSIECFNQEERIYQCFKNLFLLNSVKKYLINHKKVNILYSDDLGPFAKLYKRCAKSTYDAFVMICAAAISKRIYPVKSMLQLAFKKFSLEKSGTRKVTFLDKREMHPLRLYKGIITKYDHRLHHEWKKFSAYKNNEFQYCSRFFSDFHFNDDQLWAILDYKDAFSLKEVITYLLYLPDYTISGFEYSAFFRK